MEIYLYIVASVLIFGALMPQQGPQRKYYIGLMTLIHAFVTGFRYEHLTGDLKKYHYSFTLYDEMGWFSEELLQNGRNTAFFWLNKLVNVLSGENFQALLVVIAVIIYLILAYVIYKYSTAPWLSYLTWNCMGFFIFGLSAIKQALAMAFVMLAFVGAAERKFKLFLGAMALAGLTHMPALIFLPTYWLMRLRSDEKLIILYILLGIALYVFKEQFVAFIGSFYYEEDELMVFSGEIGNRFLMLLGFTLFGVMFRGFSDKTVSHLFHVMAIATMLQMLAGFDNIFTRLTDYYFQLSVLYLPLTFFPREDRAGTASMGPVIPFNRRSLKVLAVLVAAFMLWFYWHYNINITIAYEVDNYLDFRFMWDVP